MPDDFQRYLPVVVSILIIIAIAILREYSRTVAAIAAVMPLNIPLGMWIVYAGADDKRTAMIDFNQAILINIAPTILFMLVAYYVSRHGWDLLPTVVAGYAAWAVGLGVIFAVRAQF